ALVTWSAPAAAQSCDGECGVYNGDWPCQCDGACFGYGDCCDDVCTFCVADFAEECAAICNPACGDGFYCDAGECKACDCGAAVCGMDQCGDPCGPLDGGCAAGAACVLGACVVTACPDAGDIEDCDGVCGPTSWIGDGFCDDGGWGSNFDCEAFGWDGGDCVPCTPDCTGVECGPDPVCGDDCGACAGGLMCQDNVCVEPTCAGACGGKADMGCWCDTGCFSYGDCCPDVCEECPDLDPEACACVPDCTGKECGSNGCWGTCGTCGDGTFCDDAGTCQACDCGAQNCGWDECGNPCGALNGQCAEGSWCNSGTCQECDCGTAVCGTDECGNFCGALEGECAAGLACVLGACVETACEDAGQVEDCDGVCGPAGWIGDGICDVGGWGTDFACEAFGWDGGDCEPCEPATTCEDLGIECGAHPECDEYPTYCGVCGEGFFCDEGLCTACSCEGVECGLNACGDDCGTCAEGFLCQANACVEATCAGACGGQADMGCFCDAACFGFGDCCPDVCDECPDLDPEACACVPDCTGKECGPSGCWEDCGTCGAGEFCDENICAACDCGARVCGTDECGQPCGPLEGACPEGAVCAEGQCFEGAGCVASDEPGCGGCACEACVFALDPYCQDTAWDDQCVQECLFPCGGCGDQAHCGDGVCAFPESCSTCEADCACPSGLVCGWDEDAAAFGCFVGGCGEGMDKGCCDGDVLYVCVEPWGFLTADCAADGNICGWYPGDAQNDPRYYCGPADQLVAEDPDGVYPAACEEWTCTPDCAGLECGPDPVCGEECGPCDEGWLCVAGACTCTPDCAGLECGPDPVCGDECGPCEDGFVCEDGTCVADEPADSCEGRCGAYDADALCNCDPECFEAGDCCEDICEFCAADYEEPCAVCEPDCTGLECGPDPVCGTECGPCEDGFVCEEGACVAEGPDCGALCVGQCGDLEGCDCGGCDAGYECVENTCEFVDVVPEDVIGGEDTGGGSVGGGGGGSKCSTSATPDAAAGILILSALLGLAVLRRRLHA
ncbi:MAG: hypothetical protein FJ098_05220, partial [Deltaproteobacteria bacterium]|nr:hypothetical protein [Deltaproteobacteria bacterium]